MANNNTKVKAKQGENELAVESTTTDAPILPVEQMIRLKAEFPERASWVFDHTDAEAVYRREETKRLNTMEFVYRMTALGFALVVSVMGIGGSIYLAVHDHEKAALGLGGATLVALVGTFVAARFAPNNRPTRPRV